MSFRALVLNFSKHDSLITLLVSFDLGLFSGIPTKDLRLKYVETSLFWKKISSDLFFRIFNKGCLIIQGECIYRSGTVNSNTVNSK